MMLIIASSLKSNLGDIPPAIIQGTEPYTDFMGFLYPSLFIVSTRMWMNLSYKNRPPTFQFNWLP